MTPLRTPTLLALALTIMLMAAVPASAATVVNGDFNDGLNGWTTENAGDGLWASNADCNGTGVCYGSATNMGDSAGVMYQDVALEPGQPHELSLSFKAIIVGGGFNWTPSSPPELQRSGGSPLISTEEARIDVMPAGANPWSIDPADILGTVFAVEGGTSTVYDWQTKTFDLSPWAGQTVRLRFGWTMGQQYLDFYIDNVRIYDPTPPPPPPVPPVPDTTAPVISNAKLSDHRFESGRSGSGLMTAARSRGATLTYDLSEAATVGVSLRKYSPRSSTWSPVAGTSTLTGVAGPNRARLNARLSSRKPLSPGKYMLLLTPVDAAGNAGSPTELVVRVLRPRGSR